MCLVFFDHPSIITNNHIVREKGNVMIKWAVGEKFCGYSANKFAHKIVVNITIISFCEAKVSFDSVYDSSFYQGFINNC